MESKGTHKVTENKAPGRKPRDYECGLKLYYQPIVQPMFAKIIGYEALIRLIDKEMRFLSPAIFIPIAEKSGLNVALGAWVFEEACRTIVKMEKKAIKFDYISVNVSKKHFMKKDFLSELMKITAKYNVPSDKICLEISEFDMMNKSSIIMKRMNDLQNEGFRIAIDDFGGGFAAISKLGRLPADILKLDKSFVDRITVDKSAYDISEAVVNLSIKLNLEVVAKGVETMAQQNLLMQMGCNKMQGFLYGMPMKERDILLPKKTTKDKNEEEEEY